MVWKKRGRLFDSKRGMDIDLWFNTFELLMVFVVGLVMLETINSEATASAYEKNYFARDHALMINAIYASPGDIVYNYPEKEYNFITDFSQGKVVIYGQQEFVETGTVNYPFAEDRNYDLNYNKIQPNLKILYTKTKNVITVSGMNPLGGQEGNYGGSGGSGTFK